MKTEIDARNQKKSACSRLVNAIFGVRIPDTPELKAQDPAFDPVKQEQLLPVMEQLLEALTELERQVITSKFGLVGESKTYDQLADELGISKEAVRDIESIALRKLRHPRRSRQLKNVISE